MTEIKSKVSSQKKKKVHDASHTYLEKLVSKTTKFKVEELLDLYNIYDQLVIDRAFRGLLFPYCRIARTWLRDQARDLLAGTDRNRLILTSRFRKEADAAWEDKEGVYSAEWSEFSKPRHTIYLSRLFEILRKYPHGTIPTREEISSLGVSRLVFDDLGLYVSSMMNSYSSMVAEYCAALADGDEEEATQIDSFMRTLETEVGVRREHAWYVAVNLRTIYDQIEKMVQSVTLAYSRLLFRFAHRLRGVTTTEENFSAGYEGMMRAARNYDPVDGSSFTAHCQWWVRSAVLQRQRQASVILLPTTTWYQLSLLQRGQIELSSDRVSDLKERAEMFYANSSNSSNRYSNDGEDPQDDNSFESIYVSSPDAEVVLGDSIYHSQYVEEGYESADLSIVGREALEDVVSLLHKEDPSLIFPVLLWALNSGIDSRMLAEAISPIFLEPESIEVEKQKHKAIKTKQTQRTNQLNQLNQEQKGKQIWEA